MWMENSFAISDNTHDESITNKSNAVGMNSWNVCMEKGHHLKSHEKTKGEL